LQSDPHEDGRRAGYAVRGRTLGHLINGLELSMEKGKP
jgi:hypothetical protein